MKPYLTGNGIDPGPDVRDPMSLEDLPLALAMSFAWEVTKAIWFQDCFDSECNACREFARSLEEMEARCGDSLNMDLRFCHQFVETSDCCSATRERLVPIDPAIVVPDPENPNEFVCYDADLDLAKEACERQCEAATGLCYAECIAPLSRTTSFDWYFLMHDDLCKVMYSEACFNQVDVDVSPSAPPVDPSPFLEEIAESDEAPSLVWIPPTEGVDSDAVLVPIGGLGATSDLGTFDGGTNIDVIGPDDLIGTLDLPAP